jgi:hypothetical protein
MAKAGNRDHSTPWTVNARKGSLQDRINEDTGLKESVGVMGTGGARALETFATANLKNTNKNQSANKPFNTGGPKRS